MDKYEYKLRSEEIINLIEHEQYEEAAQIADTIDWRRVKSINMLLRVASLYRANRRNEDSRAVLQLAYERYPTNRTVLYCLCEVSIELDDVVQAIEYYKEFVKQAPRDNGVFTLRYRILEAQEASLEERIELLEELKKRDYQEEWAYELAYLYHRVGLATKCVEECDDLILWFGDGPYVMKAMELKMLHAPLTSIQEKKYRIMQGFEVPEEAPAEQEEEVLEDTYPEEAYAQPEAETSYAQANDMSQYNTINLQKVVAESMRELFPDDEDLYAANKTEVEEIEYASEQIAQLQEEPVEETQADASIEEFIPRDAVIEEAATEEASEEFIPEKAEEDIIFETAEIEPIEVVESIQEGQPVDKVSTMVEGITQMDPEPNSGAIKTVYVPEQKFQPVKPMEEEEACEEKEEEPAVFHPMTGQMNIEDVLKEWERLKTENEQKRRESIHQQILQQTGQIFTQFDASIKSGILGELETADELTGEELMDKDEVMMEEEIMAEDEAVMEEELPVEDEVVIEEELPVEDEAVIEEELPVEDETGMEEELPVEDETVDEENIQEQVSMNTAEISQLPEKILNTTQKQTKGEKTEEIREFTEEEQQLFENFIATKKVKKQIIHTIDNLTLASYTGNVIVTGEAGLGTVTMAKNLLKIFKQIEPDFSGKTAKITGSDLNTRNMSEIFEKLKKGALIIEAANGLSEKTVFDLTRLLNQEDFGLIVFLIDTKKGMQKLLQKQTMLMDYFNLRVDLVEMDNNALVTYAKNYAFALEYSIDEFGTMALYNRIERIQSGNHIVTKDEVREIIDEAIWKSKKAKFKNFVDILLAKRYDDEDMIVLRERDFM